ncbi:hypothetical protein VTK26DRAFT_7386 [Humicola hyalothermophila]
MPPIERDAPREMDRLRHQHSSSTDHGHGRALVPMWDSSDPERAPPPLPLNPQSPGVSRAGTSSAIQSAHAALTEKARENALVPHIPKRNTDSSSPERPALRPSSHRRMQSLQPGSVKDMSMMIEAGARESSAQSTPKSPEKADKAERPTTPLRSRDVFMEPKEEKEDLRASVGTPRPGPSLTPIIRPAVRRPHQSILGENTPPQSATMLALQNMSAQSNNNNSSSSSTTPAPKEPETPLANITNGSKASTKVPQSLEALSSQILTLTDIATTLQKEMALLSRRSRDNATDLMSLKEATNARDEDIRKSLRELISDAKARSAAAKEQYGGPLLLEGRPHHPSSPTQLSKSARPFSLPRIPSPTSFAASFDRESLLSTPSLCSDNSPATVALLEKIIREMGTKDGQDTLLSRLTDLANKLSGMATAEKVEELTQFIKSNQQQAVVPAAGGGRGGGGGGAIRDRSWDFDDGDGDHSRPRQATLDFLHGTGATGHPRLLPDQQSRGGPAPPPTARAADVANDDVLKAIRTVKDSVAQGGGLTAEVKALVRELRGEVLGMGRELGRRLDEVVAAETSSNSAGRQADAAATKAEVAKIIEEGLAEMTQQMNHILREHRRQQQQQQQQQAVAASSVSSSSRDSSVDYTEIYNSVRAALKDTQASKPRVPDLRREDVVQAVKDAWEKYKPEIEIQQIGLERDEVLACLQEGLRAYAPPPRQDPPPGATREEVFQAVEEALQRFEVPKVEIPPPLRRDEILDAVRECLEEFEFPVAPSAAPLEGEGALTREEVLGAVREALKEWEFPAPPPPPPQLLAAPEITRDDVLDAVNQGLQAFDFSAVSSSALVPQSQSQPLSKGDVADAVKQGLQSADLLTAETVVDAVREGLDAFDPSPGLLRAVTQGLQSFDFTAVIPRPDLSRVDVSDAVKEGMEGLDFQNTVAAAVKQALKAFDFSAALDYHDKALVPHSGGVPPPPPPHDAQPQVDVADAVREGIKSADLSRDVTEAVKKALEGFDFSSFSSALVARPGPDLSREDVVGAVKEGLSNLQLGQLCDDVADAVKKVLVAHEFSQAANHSSSSSSDLSRGDVVDAVKEGLGSLDLSAELGDAVKKELQAFDFAAAQAQSSALVAQAAAAGATDNEEVVRRLQEIKESLIAEFKAAAEETKQSSSLDAEQVVDATKGGLEKLRQDIESYVDRARGDSDPTEFMEQLIRSLDGFRDEVTELVNRSSDSSRILLKEEIESLRDAVNSSLVPALPQPGNNKEVLEALHDGFHGLRSEISTRPIAGMTEILDALQEGLGDIRTSIENLRNKPADLTANDEILDALKAGLDTVRSDIDNLREEAKNDRDRALATVNENANALVLAEPMLKQEDIKNLEVLITQLGIKVEAMESTPPPVVESLSKDDLSEMEHTLRNVAESVAALPNHEPFQVLEESLRKIQDTVAELSSREPPAAPPPASTDPASREDVEAIETILRNTKARLDDLLDGEAAVRKEHIDALETLILETRENLSGVSSQIEAVSRKEHIDTLETLILETRESLGGLATQMDVLSRKEDVAMVESLVNQIIAAFDEMKERHEKALEDPEKVTKTDVEAVEAVCLDTKSTIEQILKADLAAIPSKEDVEALETRLGDLRERIDALADANVKAFEERQAETVGVGVSVGEVKAVLEEFQALMRAKLEDGARGIDSIHSILDALGDRIRKSENVSEEVKEMFDTVKLEFEDSKASIVGAKLELDEKIQSTADVLVAKLDERMTELITKQEELQLLEHDRADKSEARDAEIEAAVTGTKVIAEELKSLVDTLGAAVTDSMEKMEEASKTVFERVEDLVNKSDENHTDGKAEHQLTREQVQEAIGKVEGLHNQVVEYQPKVLETLQEAMLMVNQHYEHLRTSALAIQERVEHPLLPPPPEKYDDTSVHEKLDTLVDHTRVADKAFEQLETLEKVHAQLKLTAAELSAFLAAQTQRIADEHEDREKTLQEVTIALERRLEEKEQVEAHLATLREEEARLKESISVTLPEEQSKITERFLANMLTEEARLKEATAALREEQGQLKETFLANLKEEQARLMETNVALKEEQDQLKETFLANLKEEQTRLMETNIALKEEQDQLKEAFLANLKEEQARLMETNVLLKEEQDKLRETFYANLREEETRLREMNDALRDEQQLLKDTFLANLREEESLLKEVNANLRQEQEGLRESFLANFKEEEQRLREANDALRQEQEQIKATLKEEQERLKVELLANLMEEESRLKEANAALRAEQEEMRASFLASLREEEERMKESLRALRAEQENLGRQKTRLTADLSSLDTALRLRREELHDMEARAENLERRILEGVMDHSRVLLMAKMDRVKNGGRDAMNRKRVVSSSQKNATASSGTETNPNDKPRNAINLAMNARGKAAPNSSSSRRILSLTQITNNVPAGGLKRSQSVRTAGMAGKPGWASGGSGLSRAASVRGKGYGDLGRGLGGSGGGFDDKENMGDLREGDEEDYADALLAAASASPAPVDIVVSGPADAGDHHRRLSDHEDRDHGITEDDDRFSDLGREDSVPPAAAAGHGGAEPESLRRSSHGTTVVTPAAEGEGEFDDVASDWTESVVGRESDVGFGEEKREAEAVAV